MGKVKPKCPPIKKFRGESQTHGVTGCGRQESKTRTDLPTRKQESDEGVLAKSEKHINFFFLRTFWYFI